MQKAKKLKVLKNSLVSETTKLENTYFSIFFHIMLPQVTFLIQTFHAVSFCLITYRTGHIRQVMIRKASIRSGIMLLGFLKKLYINSFGGGVQNWPQNQKFRFFPHIFYCVFKSNGSIINSKLNINFFCSYRKSSFKVTWGSSNPPLGQLVYGPSI